MIDRLEAASRRCDELGDLLARPDAASDLARLQEWGREQAGLEPLVVRYREYLATARSVEETEAMLGGERDPELAELARDEIRELRAKQDRLLSELREALAPRDPNDERNVFVEVRAGAGGEEAALFAGNLFRMYSRYAERRRWHVEVVNSHETGIGGYKEVVFEVRGRGAYSRLKYESGVHRVQRVPATEASGRIHTSTATVAVLPEVDDVEIDIGPEDLRIDVFRSSGAGGQNVQKTSTAIRITHIPTGMVVTCQNERSQIQNRETALRILQSRLKEIEQRKRTDAVGSTRRSQVGSGDRSEKVRTYNFPQDRLTDHRIGLTVHHLDGVLDGDLEDVVEALAERDRQSRETE